MNRKQSFVSRGVLLAVLLFMLSFSTAAQPVYKIMTYNILNYPGTTAATRNPFYKTIIGAVMPDILVIQEITSQTGVDTFLNAVLRQLDTTYRAGIFIDGPDTDNAIFFKSTHFTFISNTPVITALRDISEFVVVQNFTLDTLYLYSVHLKASSGSANELARAAEVDSLRKRTKTLHSGANYFVLGDFNIYGANEPAYQKLKDTTQNGYFRDVLNMPGTWNNSAYAPYHTQSPRTRSFGGGATGGMDDRFDMILFSQAVADPGGVVYIPSSYTAYGNDGLHFNDSINRPPNNAVGQTIADALHYASDHIPVLASFRFSEIVPVELISFNGIANKDGIELTWSTATETNNSHFEIEKSTGGQPFALIGTIPGAGTSSDKKDYIYLDASTSRGTEYSYRLKQIDFDGGVSYSRILSVVMPVPAVFLVEQNYPNPFNPSTSITFTLNKGAHVAVTIFDVLGSSEITLLNESLEAGKHSVTFNAENLSSGIYLAKIQVENQSAYIKMMLLK